jgi:hypothetical protein
MAHKPTLTEWHANPANAQFLAAFLAHPIGRLWMDTMQYEFAVKQYSDPVVPGVDMDRVLAHRHIRIGAANEVIAATEEMSVAKQPPKPFKEKDSWATESLRREGDSAPPDPKKPPVRKSPPKKR